MRLFSRNMTAWAVLLLLVAAFSPAGAATHLERRYIKTGCAACHLGFNFKSGGGPQHCLLCHGPDVNKAVGVMGVGATPRNVLDDFSKNYSHMLKKSAGKHSSREILPEIDANTPRHVECADCHKPHASSYKNPFAGVRGKRVGNLNTPITKEYELCYLCHSDSANLPPKSTNKRVEFSINNPSFHPVEGEGKNQAVISLIRPYREKKTSPSDTTVIKCVDCHGSDDPRSPRGPHGSKYPGLLTDNFSTEDSFEESSFAYALCYKCHKRSSILGNESFISHSRHITGERGFKGGGTSCHTCHTSHGSTEYRYLIRFNRDFVTDSSSGKLKFVEKGTYSFHGECWLTCHGVDHNPKSY